MAISAERPIDPNQIVTLTFFTSAGSHRKPRLRIMTHSSGEIVSKFIQIHRVWQRNLSRLVDAVLGDGDVFVDVGANIGYFSIIAAAAVEPRGRVHAFEPDPVNLDVLKKNCALNHLANVVIHQTAIGDVVETANLFRDRTNWGAHSLSRTAGLGEPMSIPVATLDEALKDEPGPVALIKLDIQGGELAALRGMGGLLARQERAPMIVIEYSSAAFKREDPELAEFERFVTTHRYQLFPFLANERPGPLPPRVDFPAFHALHDSFLRHDEDAEIDVLLSPGLPEIKRR